jgi:hypothetical protein
MQVEREKVERGGGGLEKKRVRERREEWRRQRERREDKER